MVDKVMFIPNDDLLNYPFCRLQLVVKMYGLIRNLMKVFKVLKPTIRKRFYKALGTSAKNSPMSSLSLISALLIWKVALSAHCFKSNPISLSISAYLGFKWYPRTQYKSYFITREEGDILVFTTLFPKVYNNVFLFVGFINLGIEF